MTSNRSGPRGATPRAGRPRPDPARAAPERVAEAHSRRWLDLCARHLPVCHEGSIWRYSHAPEPSDPQQGWKLHVSATVLTACDVLRKAAPFLLGRGAKFKAPRTLEEVMRLNSGVFYGYAQVGKVLTVYARSDEEALTLARGLHRLTRGIAAPSVPFDLKYGPGGAVHYRYGAFARAEVETAEGGRALAIRAPDGRLVPDARADGAAVPHWVTDPFVRDGRLPRGGAESAASPLQVYRAFRALSQRGKGGVYQAVEVGARPPRLCVLKEGRRWGEVNWDGRDGRWRIRNEEAALTALGGAGVRVPRVYASFEVEGNYYLVTEFVEGESLQAMLNRMKRRLAVGRALRLGARLARVVADIHAAGWAWRDCKPANVVVAKTGELIPLDFEGATPAGRYDPLRWCTPLFAAPPAPPSAPRPASNLPEDLYALGAVVYYLLTGNSPAAAGGLPVAASRRNVPREASAVITRLLDADPARRPCARAAAQELEAALSSAGGVAAAPAADRAASSLSARG